MSEITATHHWKLFLQCCSSRSGAMRHVYLQPISTTQIQAFPIPPRTPACNFLPPSTDTLQCKTLRYS